MKKKDVTRKLIIEEQADGKVSVVYNKDPALNGEEALVMESEGLLFLAKHGDYFKKVVVGNSETIGRLIYGTYHHAVKSASKGVLEEAYLAEMIEKVCEDIVKVARFRNSKVTIEEVMKQLEAREGLYRDDFDSGVSH